MAERPFSLVTAFGGHAPLIAPGVFVDRSARLIGRVSLASGASVWPGAVLRADEEAIAIGEDAAVWISACWRRRRPAGGGGGPGRWSPTRPACTAPAWRREPWWGVGAIVLDGAVVETGALLGAGALLPPGGRAPAGWLCLGAPAKPIRELKPAERENLARQVAELKEKARAYLAEGQD